MSELVEMFQKAQFLHRAGSLYPALALYEEILLQAPSHAETNHYAGVCLYQLGHYDSAYEKIAKAITLNPNDAVQLNHLALVSLKKGKVRDADQQLIEALTLDPNYLDATANLGICRLAQNRYKDAAELLYEVNARRPDDVNTLNNIGLALAAMGEDGEAKKYFERGTILSPTNVSLGNNLARALIDCEEIDKAVKILTQLVDDGRANAETYYFLHSAIVQRRNEIAFIKRAYELKPSDDGIVAAYATSLWAQNKCKAARQLFLDCCDIIKEKEFLDSEERPKKVTFHPDDAVTALIDLFQELEVFGGSYWLDFGTLLGFVREGGPLKHDKDADIGMDGDVDRKALVDVIHLSKTFDLHPNTSIENDRIQYNLTLVHRKLNIAIDIFFYNQYESGAVTCGFWKHPAAVTWSFDNIPRLGKITVDGNDFPVPDDPSKHLEKIYGPTWMVPDKLFDTVLSAHNLCRSSLETSTLFGLQRLINSVRTGRIEKAIYYLDVLLGFDANLPLKDLKIRLEKEL